MTTIASRELRNHTADVLRQVSAGKQVTITVNGTPVAELHPIRTNKRASMPKRELVNLLTYHQTDAGLRVDLEVLAGETTDDLGPIR